MAQRKNVSSWQWLTAVMDECRACWDKFRGPKGWGILKVLLCLKKERKREKNTWYKGLSNYISSNIVFTRSEWPHSRLCPIQWYNVALQNGYSLNLWPSLCSIASLFVFPNNVKQNLEQFSSCFSDNVFKYYKCHYLLCIYFEINQKLWSTLLIHIKRELKVSARDVNWKTSYYTKYICV